MTKRIMYLTSSAIGLTILVFVILLVGQSAVLVRIPDFRSARRHPLLLVLNPSRDKRPEAVAESFLKGLRDGKCVEATSSLDSGETVEICNKQVEYPLLQWEIIDFQVEGRSLLLTYKHTSKNAIASEDMFVWVDINGQDSRVTKFAIGY